MFQYNKNGQRWYYSDGKWYASVTGFVKNSLPTPPHLIQWYKSNTEDFVNQTLKDTSDYGTRFHAHVEELLRTGTIEVADLEERIQIHLAAIAQFFHDYEVKPITIEARLKHDASEKFPLNFAGTVDLIAETKDGVSIVDWKTGGIQDSHKYQMMCYYLAWAQARKNAGETYKQKVVFINVRPKDWIKSPSYEVKKWSVGIEDWERLSAMMRIFDFDLPKPFRIFDSLKLGQQPTYTQMEVEKWISQQIDREDSVI